MSPSIPDGQLVYAVGDIHGRADLLAHLLAQIEADAARSGVDRPALVFLGDYVDRGPDSCGVVELLIAKLPGYFQTHFLKGNHEAMLLDFLDDPSALRQWLMNRGETTMQSYGVDVEKLERDGADAVRWRRAFVEALPEAHRRFYESLELTVSFGDYLFVHAGIKPGVPLEAQDPHDLIWIRQQFLKSEGPFGKIVVHGHTPVNAPEIRANRIDIDTWAVATGKLTALRLGGATRRFLQT